MLLEQRASSRENWRWMGVFSPLLEKAMAPHSSTLAWKIPWTEEPGRLQAMRSLRVRHDWATSLSLFTFMHWRRKWQSTPVFLPGESQGRGEPGGLLSMGSHRVGHDWSDLAAAAVHFYTQGTRIGIEVLRVICWLDEAHILGAGKNKANTSSLWARRGDRLYCSINSYNMGEGRMIRVWFFHSRIPRPSSVSCSFSLESPQ